METFGFGRDPRDGGVGGLTVAYVFSGGAGLGAAQVGMAQALDNNGVEPEMVIGTWVGAVNGARLAGGGSPDELADLWRSPKRDDLFPLRPLGGLLGVIGRRSHIISNHRLRRLLDRNRRFGRLEDAQIAFSVIAFSSTAE